MIPLFSTSQIRKTDEFAINQSGYPSIVLMENAAISVFNTVLQKLSFSNEDNIIGFVCGKGNNGGDGFAIARHFFLNGYKVKIINLCDEKDMSVDARINFNILKSLLNGSENKIKLRRFQSLKDLNFLKDCTVIFDAMLGSGTIGELKTPYLEIVERLNAINAFKVAVDIPTGLDADKGYGKNVFKADLTVTLAEFKKGLFFESGYSNCGEVVKGSIGIPDSFFDYQEVNEYLIEPVDAFNSLPKKDKNQNKYSAGKVLCICGSEQYPGAALLTSLSALKSGAGATVLCFPKSIRKLVHSKHPELVIYNYEDEKLGSLTENAVDELKDKIKWSDCVALGPGIGRSIETQKAIISLLQKFPDKKMVIDADAIYALANNNYKNINLKDKILTPHYGEFANLINTSLKELESDLLFFGRKFSIENNTTLVLKGPRTIIFRNSGEAFINTSGNVGLAKFGSGDVLSGIISSFVAQNKEIEQSTYSAVYLHGLSADILKSTYTEYGFLSSDLINNIPNTIKFLKESFVQVS